MKIEIELSEKNESTSYPYWLIIDPEGVKDELYSITNAITGPFFSRESAENHLKRRHYAFSDNAVVYCKSGCWSNEYIKSIDDANLEVQNEI